MALGEDQIVRFSRQILLKEVGGAGQERLLGSRVALSGQGAALAVAADYLAAAGVTIVLPDRPVRAEEVGFGRSRAQVGESWSLKPGAEWTERSVDARPRTDRPASAPYSEGEAAVRTERFVQWGSAADAERPESAHRSNGDAAAPTECFVHEGAASEADRPVSSLCSDGEAAAPTERFVHGTVAALPCSIEPVGFTVALGGASGSGAIAFVGPAGCRPCFAQTIASWGPPPEELATLLGATAALAAERILLGLEASLGVRRFLPDGVSEPLDPVRCQRCSKGHG